MEAGSDSGAMAVLSPAASDDGYVSPEFDLPSDSEDEQPPPSKRIKNATGGGGSTQKAPSALEDYEQLALKMLRGN